MAGGQKGFTLIGVMIALTLLSVISISFMGALATATTVLAKADELDTARSLAESQMEYIKRQPYGVSYAPGPISSDYTGYDATITTADAASRDANLQKITVVINHNTRQVMMLDGYKAKR